MDSSDTHQDTCLDTASLAVVRPLRLVRSRGRTRALVPAERPLQPDNAIIDGPKLRQLRRKRGLSIERLAWAAGLSITTVGRLERDERPRCRISTLHQLADELGADPAAIAILIRPVRTARPYAPQPRQPDPGS